ncbi:hypothetical protein GF351_05530 [Candidatus Woesearchaeota archaeon]|nr:hypothetical protein [Candidatus Woesearchaeota archaeon]
MNKKRAFVWVMSAVLVMFLFSAPAQAQVLDDLFRYYDGSAIADFYIDYHLLFDLLIYILLFVGISQVAFKDRFQGRGGRAVIIAVGLSLSVGMMMFEYYYDWMIGDIAPLGLAVMLAVIAIFIYRLATDIAGMAKTGAGALAFVITYLFARASFPEMNDWIRDEIPLLNALLVIAFVIALVRVIWALWKVAFPGTEEPEAPESRQEQRAEREVRREAQQANRQARQVQRQASREMDLDQELDRLAHSLIEYLNNLPDGPVADEAELNRIDNAVDAISQKINQRQALQRHLERALERLRHWEQELRDQLQHMPEAAARADPVIQRINHELSNADQLINAQKSQVEQYLQALQRIDRFKQMIRTRDAHAVAQTIHDDFLPLIRHLMSLEHQIRLHITKIMEMTAPDRIIRSLQQQGE